MGSLGGALGAMSMGFILKKIGRRQLLIGIGSQLGVLYITEIAPLKIRGSLGMINQLMITLGILFASILGLENVFGTDSAWCNIFLMNVASCILCSFCMMFIPESPQYLSINPKDKEKTIADIFGGSNR
ncbi:hypothetical protein A3Q56_06073 [Intoshia linei]|uniref:Major facilitator superfamily (MFS) profile domain-containing protein n=1 Tax=Intoshia linei TaxID=1819745 RepID=A0A177AW10_9BILA|nr:hypothetical protein A3Q56_06073 [Intoshia linei]